MLEIAIILIVGFALGYGVREWVSRRRRRGSDVPLGGSYPPGRHLAVDLYGSGVIGGRRQDHESSHSGAFGTPGVGFSAIPISGIAAGTFSRTRQLNEKRQQAGERSCARGRFPSLLPLPCRSPFLPMPTRD